MRNSSASPTSVQLVRLASHPDQALGAADERQGVGRLSLIQMVDDDDCDAVLFDQELQGLKRLIIEVIDVTSLPSSGSDALEDVYDDEPSCGVILKPPV
jgi:hypothetical protein